ncbi:hypothetical protein SY2F82_26720 [Streptomyces sp. Y2F8-2]|uniref:hypothetical protein n=1 Tax=Streptomyces sp. Y2F8-2 TaxID=2759675 RepID=UPI0019088996|nr:hypothetical protein [Streptomyces sp. Y2F8-2]GHK00875.1 hypothetical protein SY2F82_26720 [Streptomyces sp. Y2F8-2]
MENEDDALDVVPDFATTAAWAFYKHHHAQMLYMTSASMVFREFESLVERLGVAFADVSPDGPEKRFPHWYEKRAQFKETLHKNLPMVSEYGMTRCVENFLSYVSDVLTETLVSSPALLKSQEQVTYEEVLAHDSIEAFAAWAAERRISQLSYKGLEDIAAYIEKRLGLKIHESDKHWMLLRRGVAIRNLAVHRRGIIDERFMRIVPDAKKGERYRFNLREYIAVASSAIRVVIDFDTKVAAKFGLARISKDDSGVLELYSHLVPGERKQAAPSLGRAGALNDDQR